MTPKRAVAEANRIAKQGQRFPTPRQVGAFLLADGFVVSGQLRATVPVCVYEKAHPKIAGEYYTFTIPLQDAFEFTYRVREICESIAIMKGGDRLLADKIVTIIAKIEVQ